MKPATGNLQKHTFETTNYKPIRFGVKEKDHQIILEYHEPRSGKTFHHYIKLKKYVRPENMQRYENEV